MRLQTPTLLIDFGSTYTKLVVVDLARELLVAQSAAVTTADTDITIGLREALARLPNGLGREARHFPHKLACSSAAGGLRVVAIGLVPELTAEAAKRAALGAGARVLAAYAHHLTLDELQQIVALAPDVVLLAGGTDGGNQHVILHNARVLAQSTLSAPVVVAGNKDVAADVAAILRRGGKDVRVAENVMPRLGQINVHPARQAIRGVFVERIVEARGFKAAEAYVERILMPTPAAVSVAAQLLAEGMDDGADLDRASADLGRASADLDRASADNAIPMARRASGKGGLGELMVVDIGGATTDVHSIAVGESQDRTVIQRGLPEPYAKRTVEGDLGLRVSAVSLLEAAGQERLREHIGLASDLDLEGITRALAEDVGRVPDTAEEQAIDRGMARSALEQSVARHVGTLRELYLPTGHCFIQEGKDLTRVGHLIGTGGIFSHTTRVREILMAALFSDAEPLLLKPRAPRLWVDRRYILWAMGLLAEVSPGAALRLMLEHLEEV